MAMSHSTPEKVKLMDQSQQQEDVSAVLEDITEIGYFSRNCDFEGGDSLPQRIENDKILLDKSQLASYTPPDPKRPLSWNLNDGYKEWVEKTFRMDYCIDDILNYLIKLKHNGDHAKLIEIFKANVICRRGTLVTMACCHKPWMLGSVRFNGVTFLINFATESEKRRKRTVSDYWGHRFEKYMTNSEGVVDSNKQYHAVYSYKLTPTSTNAGSSQPPSLCLVYSAEIDCEDDKGEYIELKTTNERKPQQYKEMDLVRWWLQCYFAKINRIECGYKDERGIVYKLETVDAARPASSRDHFINTLYQQLVHICDKTPDPKSGHLGKMVVFKFNPDEPQAPHLVPNPGYTRDQALPDWFVRKFNKD